MDRKEVYIFDLDGTLVDSISAFIEAACDVITKYWPELTREEARRIYTSTLGMTFQEQLEFYGMHHPRAISEWNEVNHKITPNAPLFDGVLKFMESRDDVYLGIVSSNLSSVVNKVISKYFPYLLDWASGCELGTKPQQIDKFFERYFLTDISATYFGDTEHDRRIADEIGMKFVLIEGAESWKALIGSHS